MRTFPRPSSTKDAESYELFCDNLLRTIAKMDKQRPQHRATIVELRNLAFAHFVAVHRLIRAAVKDDPVLSEFRDEIDTLSTKEYLQIVGLMHAYGARKCYGDSPQTLSLLFDCIVEAYEMPDVLASSWGQPCDLHEHARLRARQIAGILGRPQDAERLAPSLCVLDRKILFYLAFLVQKPELGESIQSELTSAERHSAE